MTRIALVLLALWTASCAREGTATAVSAASEPPVVAVAKVTRVTLTRDLDLTAEFQPFQEVDVMAKVSGYVREIKVDIGDRVREGQQLALLEIPEMQDDLTRAAASIEEAQAELATARDELQRAQSAHEAAHLSYSRVLDVSKKEPGLVPQQEVDEVHARDLVAEAQISGARSHVTACEQRIHVAQAEQARFKTMAQYETITAPFAGVVTQRYANTGSLIQAGTSSQAVPVVRVSENGLLRLALPVPESAVPQIRLGEPVEVRVPALNRSFPGKVARFVDKVDSVHADHEYRGRRSKPESGSHSRDVRRGESDDGAASRRARRSGGSGERSLGGSTRNDRHGVGCNSCSSGRHRNRNRAADRNQVRRYQRGRQRGDRIARRFERRRFVSASNSEPCPASPSTPRI